MKQETKGRCGFFRFMSLKKVLVLLIIPTYLFIFIIMKSGHLLQPSALHPSLTWENFVNISDSAVHQVKNSLPDIPMDIHLNIPGLGHTGEVMGHGHSGSNSIKPNTIAIGGGITSAKIPHNCSKQIMKQKFPLFNVMLPSFCETCGTKYSFHFYFAYDYTDKLFSNPTQLQAFAEVFYSTVTAKCPPNLPVELHMVQCDHMKKPAWAQNDAMVEAYMDNMEYFYRVNDDSRLKSAGWAEVFVDTLKQFDPPNLGVVGPKHMGGNVNILTYDFTHHTHQDMFGFHYPRDFTDWYADDWVTGVYKPGRVEKIKSIALQHTMQLGQRYRHHMDGKKLGPRYKQDKALLLRYVNYLKTKNDIKQDTRKVIAYSLFNNHPNHTMGVLRNVQLAPMYFPEWTVRVYVPTKSNTVPHRLITKLRTLGADVRIAESKDYSQLSLHVLSDSTVDVVLFRLPEHRLTLRQKSTIDDWLSSESLMHCMRDHISHASTPLVPGLIGIKLSTLRDNLEKHKQLMDMLAEASGKQNPGFEEQVWKLFQTDFMCHDSVSCTDWPNSRAFPVNMDNDIVVYEGQIYDEHMAPKVPYVYNSTLHKCRPTVP